MGDEYSSEADAGGAGRARACRGSEPDGGAAGLRIDVLTLFPGMFAGPFEHSIVARAVAAGLVEIGVHDLRDWTTDSHRTTDDYAYGGGGGMVMMPGPVFRAVEDLLGLPETTAADPVRSPVPIVLTTPQGRPFTHALARELASARRVVLLCGRYEGYDERIREHLATHEVSVGDFVVSGGELPAMLIVDAMVRLRPGALGLATAPESDSFAAGLLEHPHFTRPADFRGWRVPDVLVSGHHAEIERWRRRESLQRTLARRPDCLDEADLAAEERSWLRERGWTPGESRPRP